MRSSWDRINQLDVGKQVRKGCSGEVGTEGRRVHEHTATIWVQKGHDTRPNGQSGALDVRERDVTGIVRRRPVEHGEAPAPAQRGCDRSCDGGEELMAAFGEGRCPWKYGILHIGHITSLSATMLFVGFAGGKLGIWGKWFEDDDDNDAGHGWESSRLTWPMILPLRPAKGCRVGAGRSRCFSHGVVWL